MEKALDAALVWFRRDLRVADHAALYHALQAARQVWCAFVFDRAILDRCRAPTGASSSSSRSVDALAADLARLGERYGVAGVRLLRPPRRRRRRDRRARRRRCTCRRSSPTTTTTRTRSPRDARTRGALADRGVALHTSKDHVVFERSEVLTLSGKPYSVFTPYRTAWLSKLDRFFLSRYPVERHAGALAPRRPASTPRCPTLARLGFVKTNLEIAQGPARQRRRRGAARRLPRAASTTTTTARDYPAVKGPSYLVVHLRFGTISIRRLAGAARARIAEAEASSRAAPRRWLSELVWRDFYQQVLHHLPHVVGAQLQARVRPPPLRARPPRRRALRGLVRGAHRLSAGRCGDGADQPDRLDAQPAAHGDGELSRQGPRHRLAPRRGATSPTS